MGDQGKKAKKKKKTRKKGKKKKKNPEEERGRLGKFQRGWKLGAVECKGKKWPTSGAPEGVRGRGTRQKEGLSEVNHPSQHRSREYPNPLCQDSLFYSSFK